MRYSAIVLGFFGLAIAEPTLMQRQAQTIINVVNNIDTQVKALDTAIQSYNGGDTTSLLSASNAVLTATSNGVQTVNGATSVSLTDALTIQSSIQTLTTDLNTTISDIVAKKSQLVAAGAGGTVEQNLQQQLTAAQSLSTAIASKVPSSVASLAQQLSQGIINAINVGITAFQGTGSASSGGASSATAASTVGGASVTNKPTTTTAKTTAFTSAPAVFTGAAMPLRPEQMLGGLAAAVVLAL
jgi:hypothetical protein